MFVFLPSLSPLPFVLSFFFNDTATPEIYTLSLHDALPISTGGWGPNEAFVEPGKGLLAASLGTTRSTFETPCGAYGQFKITRYLLRVTRDSRYGDSMEQVLYNTIAGAKPILADGASFYYSDYHSEGARKVYYKDKWPCCSGTFPH